MSDAAHTLTPAGHFGLAVAAGLVAGMSSAGYSHSRINLPTATEVVCGEGPDIALSAYPFLPDTGGSISFVSSDAADTAVVLRVSGLNPDGSVRVADITLTGTTPVVSTAWRRVNSVVTVGTVAHLGTVTVSRVAGAAVMFTALPGAQRAFPGIVTIAAGRSAAILRMISSMQKDGGSNTATIVRVYTRREGMAVFTLAFESIMQRDGDASPEFENDIPSLIPPLTDIAITVESETAAAAAFVRTSWVFLDNEAYGLNAEII